MCQRFWLLVNSPHLLRSVSIDDYGLPRLSALCHWLRPRAAGAVRSLSLHMRLADNHLEEELEEQQALVSSVLMACGGNMGGGVEPQLEQLDLDFGNIHLDCSLELLEVSGSWFPPLRGLTRLVLSSNVDMVVSAPLGVLSNLRELGLSGSPAQLLPAVALPPSLTRLEMMTDTPLGTAPTPLPKQVGHRCCCTTANGNRPRVCLAYPCPLARPKAAASQLCVLSRQQGNAASQLYNCYIYDC